MKCIFIDPPYNTKSAFEHYDDHLEHSQWLSMMLPRLQLLRELLREDGSIWVTIDDNEGHYLKVLMDEVFGRRNFIANVLWQKVFSPKNTARHFSEDHDHVLVFAKVADVWRPNEMPRSEKLNASYKNPDADPRGAWTSGDLSARNFYGAGTYPIECPSGRVIVGPPNGMYWRVSAPKFKEMDLDGRIWWGAEGNNTPRIKRFLTEVRQGVVPQTLWMNSEVGNTQEAKKEVVAIFGAENFMTPKPERLIQRILHIATHAGDLVLDSFLGSGTTAAVAQKMGRRWIGIEMGDHAATHCVPRLEKVIAGEQGGISAAVGWRGGGGFRFARLGAPVFDAEGRIHPDVRFATLAAFIWQQETGTALDAAVQGIAGTPYLGTHSVFDSFLPPDRLPEKAVLPIFSETAVESQAEPAPDTPLAPSPVGGRPGRGLTEGAAAGPHPSPPPAGDEAIPPSSPPVRRSRTAYYLLFNGILGDKRPASGNVLTQVVLDALLALHATAPHAKGDLGGSGNGDRNADGVPLVVYGEACRLGAARLAQARVVFKHIPYDVKAR